VGRDDETRSEGDRRKSHVKEKNEMSGICNYAGVETHKTHTREWAETTKHAEKLPDVLM